MPPFDFALSIKNQFVFTELDPCDACPVRRLTVCAALEAEELARLAEIVQSQRVEAHQPLFAEGEPATHLFTVTAGTVKLYKLLPDGRRQITGFLFSGDFLGLSVNERYAYSAETVVTSTLCRFPRRQMDPVLDAFPKLQRRLFALAATELAAAQDQMVLLGRKTATEKVASFLLGLSARAVRRGQQANPVHLPMTRTDMADYLGLTTETVSRTVSHLKSSGAIRLLEGGRVQIVDKLSLGDLAEGG